MDIPSKKDLLFHNLKDKHINCMPPYFVFVRTLMLTQNMIEWGAGPGGGLLDYEISRCVCWGSKNVPISMKDAFGKKNTLILKGSSAYLKPIL